MTVIWTPANDPSPRQPAADSQEGTLSRDRSGGRDDEARLPRRFLCPRHGVVLDQDVEWTNSWGYQKDMGHKGHHLHRDCRIVVTPIDFDETPCSNCGKVKNGFVLRGFYRQALNREEREQAGLCVCWPECSICRRRHGPEVEHACE
jgi:hypothetical protein